MRWLAPARYLVVTSQEIDGDFGKILGWYIRKGVALSHSENLLYHHDASASRLYLAGGVKKGYDGLVLEKR